MTDPNFRIETGCLYISYYLPTSPAHCTFLVELSNSSSFIAQCGNTGITTTEQAKTFIKNRFVATHARHGRLTRRVVLPDVGFAMLPEVSSQGYVTEAARKLLEYASEALGIKEFFGFTDAKNIASRRVLEKLGLEDRGVYPLKVFENHLSSVYTSPGMMDLKVYGIE
ncbi:hypothetical protein DFS33DRAFT_1378865 [Desarmillaria ectypa]|nr:hypothetical protein DFS33DRAFT_1378865 [Desarmillaria ectypa]